MSSARVILRLASAKYTVRTLLLVSGLAVVAAQAQTSQFQHIIVVFQENRTPDNLFYALCASFPCSTTPNNTQYNIQVANWLDKTSPNGVTQPTGIPLAAGYPTDHSHSAFKGQCDMNTEVNPPQCQMDGAAVTSRNRGAFAFVENTVNTKYPNGVLNPYLTLATQYGWANFMFQTNQGPSFPAHQFIFGGTSALDASDDAKGSFLSDNPNGFGGCYAQDGERIHWINSAGVQQILTINYAEGITICLTRTTMADLLDNANIGWKYYSMKAGGTDRGASIWTAPNAIQTICEPDANHMNCTGSEWANHVDLNPADVLSDLGMNGSPCKLQGVSWVIPTGGNSDHGGNWGGPDWVGSIVNALGASKCLNPDGSSYWNTTAVVITWDDWGGWYDHVPPPILPYPQGGYQMGFRVPLIFVSAFTPAGYIDNLNYDFGSILRFIENNFGLGLGALGFADSRATTDFSTFYNFGQTPARFIKIPVVKTPVDFLNDKTPPTDPDDD
jgi:phospholipase C